MGIVESNGLRKFNLDLAHMAQKTNLHFVATVCIVVKNKNNLFELKKSIKYFCKGFPILD